jgi:hypothetical protein
MPLILHEVQQQYPDLEIHQIEAGVPEQFQRLVVTPVSSSGVRRRSVRGGG